MAIIHSEVRNTAPLASDSQYPARDVSYHTIVKRNPEVEQYNSAGSALRHFQNTNKVSISNTYDQLLTVYAGINIQDLTNISYVPKFANNAEAIQSTVDYLAGLDYSPPPCSYSCYTCNDCGSDCGDSCNNDESCNDGSCYECDDCYTCGDFSCGSTSCGGDCSGEDNCPSDEFCDVW